MPMAMPEGAGTVLSSRLAPSLGIVMNAPATLREVDTRAIARPEELAGYEMIRRLVGFPTVSRDSNLELIEWVDKKNKQHNTTTTHTNDDERHKTKHNNTKTARDGNATTGGIVLSGHT